MCQVAVAAVFLGWINNVVWNPTKHKTGSYIHQLHTATQNKIYFVYWEVGEPVKINTVVNLLLTTKIKNIEFHQIKLRTNIYQLFWSQTTQHKPPIFILN